MNKSIESKLLAFIKKNKQVKTAEIAAEFGVSRAYASRLLTEMTDEKRLIRLGETNQSRYVLFDANNSETSFATEIVWRRRYARTGLEEGAVFQRIKKSAQLMIGIPDNTVRIFEYAFSEMLNNAIDHSQSKIINVTIGRTHVALWFLVEDRGVGIWNNIMKKRHVKSELEALQDVLKGRQTTAPEMHSGQGIFFTSKASDTFWIVSGRTLLRVDNTIPDTFVQPHRLKRGTTVGFSIGIQTKMYLRDVFRRFSDVESGFDRTEIMVRLFVLDEHLVSRSQARRLLAGLDDFKKITLDFDRVDSIGQGFADEIFRVYARMHTDKEFVVLRASPEVQFMIDRAKAERI